MSKIERLTLPQLEESYQLVSDNRIITYPHPKSYYDVFANLIGQESTQEIEISASHPRALKDNNAENPEIAWQRYRFEIVDRDAENPDLTWKTGLIASTTNNSIQLYCGSRTEACMNLCIFRADQISRFQMLKTTMGQIEGSLDTMLNQSQMHFDNSFQVIEHLKTQMVNPAQSYAMIGMIYSESFAAKPRWRLNQSLGRAVKEFDNPDSIYSYPFTGNQSLWNFYNALTHDSDNQFVIDAIPGKSNEAYNAIEHTAAAVIA